MNGLYLKTSTARQIVQRTMDIIKHSVNVMDQQGIIIASGDNSRLHQRHEGAILAITENRIVQIEQTSTTSLQGVKPGINLPIYFRQHIVGAVGISGNPADVLNYAELVKMAAELILEQAAMLEQKQWDKRYKEELTHQLIAESADQASIKAMAAYMDLDLSTPRVVVLLELINATPEALRTLMEYFNHNEPNYLLTISSFNELLLLKPISFRQQSWNLVQEKKTLQQLQSRFPTDLNTRFIIGGYFTEQNGIRRSYLTAKATQEMASRTNNTNKYVFYTENPLPVLLGGLTGNWQAKELTQSWLSLQEKDVKGTLQHTIQHYFLQNCDLAQTAKSLHIHVNTLRYRLQRIEAITNLKINELQGLLWLYIGMQLSD